MFIGDLTDYEKGEILDYQKIYFLGGGAKKIKGSPFAEHNFGYDDERGDYKVVMRDHMAYRYEVLKPLGRGSFGQVSILEVNFF
jgi:dual specificity tyrosine-phosphorylation-regulated kinase 2/3/4